MFDCIEVFYNPILRHSAIRQVSPAEFERRCASTATAAQPSTVHEGGATSAGRALRTRTRPIAPSLPHGQPTPHIHRGEQDPGSTQRDPDNRSNRDDEMPAWVGRHEQERKDEWAVFMSQPSDGRVRVKVWMRRCLTCGRDAAYRQFGLIN